MEGLLVELLTVSTGGNLAVLGVAIRILWRMDRRLLILETKQGKDGG